MSCFPPVEEDGGVFRTVSDLPGRVSPLRVRALPSVYVAIFNVNVRFLVKINPTITVILRWWSRVQSLSKQRTPEQHSDITNTVHLLLLQETRKEVTFKQT